MKLTNFILIALALLVSTSLVAQQPTISNLRPYDQEGVNKFEYLKKNNPEFDGLKVRIGGAFAQQFQGLDHTNTTVDLDGDGMADNALYNLEPGFNLATANLNLDVQLARGVRLNLITYLSSRHHPEAWVKGGFIQFDELPFFNSETVDNIMDNVMIRVGHMEINYGDAHFRRTDNGNAMYNPFVGNYIVDAFNTEIGAEIYYTKNDFIGMLGMTGGEINGNVGEARTSAEDDKAKRSPTIIGKFGYDGNVAENVRLRLTGSAYHTESSSANHLFTGDRGGSRYYLVMEEPGSRAGSAFRSGRYNPGYNDQVTAVVGSAFLKAGGFELFGFYENANGRSRTEADTRAMDHIAAEAIYRFGKNEDVYIGARYNTVSSEDPSGADVTINRYQLGGG
ncbi:MAG TPA: hypothetical protein VJ933_03285, partial [Phaeodactylibacter sp.]|nr:hypothetical protein [Phaeodactylibacter sp.]